MDGLKKSMFCRCWLANTLLLSCGGTVEVWGLSSLSMCESSRLKANFPSSVHYGGKEEEHYGNSLETTLTVNYASSTFLNHNRSHTHKHTLIQNVTQQGKAPKKCYTHKIVFTAYFQTFQILTYISNAAWKNNYF